jgi:sortase A
MRNRKAFALGFMVAGAGFIAHATYIPAKASLAQALLERAWAKTLSGEKNVRPWPWADITPVAELEIPRVALRAIVLEGVSGEAMAFGPGHMPNTPPIGAGGTAVLAAHRDTQFQSLGELREGDVIATVTRDGRRTEFRVSAAFVAPADASGLDPADRGPNGARLALVTCYPFTGVLNSPWRYVVLADRVAAPEETASVDRNGSRT